MCNAMALACHQYKQMNMFNKPEAYKTLSIHSKSRTLEIHTDVRQDDEYRIIHDDFLRDLLRYHDDSQLCE